MRIGHQRRRGFTLIETLAAFAILTISLAQLFHSTSLGSENQRFADFLMRSTTSAQSHLAKLMANHSMTVGHTSGKYENGLTWSLNIRYDRSTPSSNGSPALTAYRLKLDVFPEFASKRSSTFFAEKLITSKVSQ